MEISQPCKTAEIPPKLGPLHVVSPYISNPSVPNARKNMEPHFSQTLFESQDGLSLSEDPTN